MTNRYDYDNCQCGALKAYRAATCRSCYLAKPRTAAPAPTCPDCGGPMYAQSRRCRACADKARRHQRSDVVEYELTAAQRDKLSNNFEATALIPGFDMTFEEAMNAPCPTCSAGSTMHCNITMSGDPSSYVHKQERLARLHKARVDRALDWKAKHWI